MKKIISALLAVLMCFSLASCTSNGSGDAVLEQLTDFSTTAIGSDGETVVAEESNADEQTATTAEAAADNNSTTNGGEESTTAPKGGDTSTSKAKAPSKKAGNQENGQLSTTKQTTKKSSKQPTINKNQGESFCYITIDCTKILDYLKKHGKKGYEQYLEYIPKSGYIIHNYKCTYKSGDTVYDILKRACDENNIDVNATDSVYGIYVEGINNISEKNFGKYSGWMYSVNGTPPPISCGKFKASPSDEIIFYYTC
mgnify:CR=1 FL=1